MLKRHQLIDLWSDSTCLCPMPQYEVKYIIFGKESKAKLFFTRLLYSHKTIVLKKTHFLAKLLRTWKRRYNYKNNLPNYDAPKSS